MRITLTLLVLWISFPLLSQHQCGNDHFFDASAFKELKKRTKPTPTKSSDTKYINTVVHVIYNEDQPDVEDSTIIRLIEDLNYLLTAEDLDESIIHPIHRDKITDTQLQFCLASRDPDGNLTNGITHREATVYFSADAVFAPGSGALESVKNYELGGTSPWDLDNYFNIWIAPIEDEGFTLSYGVPPPSFYPIGPLLEMLEFDLIPGALIDLENMEILGEQNYFVLLGLFAHECGHALGLMHTFGATADPSASDFCTFDDLVEDTPICNVDLSNCFFGTVNSCGFGVNDLPDMHSNFMSYSSCQTMFSPEQIGYMSENLKTTPGLYKSACFDFSLIEKSEDRNSIDVLLFPNPNTGSFTIITDDQDCSNLKVEVLNAAGSLIRTLDNVIINEVIDLGDLDSGIYFIKMVSEDRSTTKKLWIEH